MLLFIYIIYEENANECFLGYWLIIYLKKFFIEKEKKNNILIVFFFISYKNGINTFLKWIVN